MLKNHIWCVLIVVGYSIRLHLKINIPISLEIFLICHSRSNRMHILVVSLISNCMLIGSQIPSVLVGIIPTWASSILLLFGIRLHGLLMHTNVLFVSNIDYHGIFLVLTDNRLLRSCILLREHLRPMSFRLGYVSLQSISCGFSLLKSVGEWHGRTIMRHTRLCVLPLGSHLESVLTACSCHAWVRVGGYGWSNWMLIWFLCFYSLVSCASIHISISIIHHVSCSWLLSQDWYGWDIPILMSMILALRWRVMLPCMRLFLDIFRLVNLWVTPPAWVNQWVQRPCPLPGKTHLSRQQISWTSHICFLLLRLLWHLRPKIIKLGCSWWSTCFWSTLNPRLFTVDSFLMLPVTNFGEVRFSFTSPKCRWLHFSNFVLLLLTILSRPLLWCYFLLLLLR